MNLSNQNLREKEFHNNLQSTAKGRFENFFYKAIINAWKDFFDYLKLHANNKEILDYGCGIGPTIEKVLKFNPKKITGIDISDVSIKNAKEKFSNLNSKVNLLVDNCEKTQFDNNSFDIVYGLGILHHLQIEKSVSEIARVLKPNGTFLFIEPLGTNPLINFYRRLTPRSRSKDEHPLLQKDFEFIEKEFLKVKLKYYGFLTLIFFPFYRVAANSTFYNFLTYLDQILFKIKFFRLFAWSVLIIAKKK